MTYLEVCDWSPSAYHLDAQQALALCLLPHRGQKAEDAVRKWPYIVCKPLYDHVEDIENLHSEKDVYLDMLLIWENANA